MEIMNYCLNDFDISEEHYYNFFKAKNKKDSKFYYIKKYNNQKIEKENFESLKNKMYELSQISNLKFFGLFEEVNEEEKDIYLIFEFFHGKLVCNNNDFQNYEIWVIALKLLEIFEKLSEKGIKFNKNNVIEVFEINLNELKINIFDLINNNNINDKNENNEILYNIGVIVDKIINENCFFKGFINDLKNNKINILTDILVAKTQFKQFLKYSLYFDNINNEITNYKEMIYSGSLKDGKPNGIGILVNEYGLFYQGEFKEGEIDGEGKIFIYNKNNESLNKIVNKELPKPKKTINNPNDLINSKNLIKILQGTFTKGIKNGKFIEYNKNNSKTFEGIFKDDIKNGIGIEYNNGYKIFEGEYKDDIKNGKGIQYSNGKKIFEGEFKEGKRNGKGILYNNELIKIYVGDFENNYFNGNGALFYNDGKILYQGTFKNGFFWEKGVYFDIFGEKIKVTNGLPDKNCKIYNNSGKIHYYLSKKKEKIEGKEYYETGKIKYAGTFKIINMKEIDINNLEKLRNKNEYNCIIKDGHGTSYDSNGKKLYKGDFHLGSYKGEGKLFEYNYSENNAYKIYEGSFLDGKFHGNGIKYFLFKNSKEYEGEFKNGKYEGKGIKYKINGDEEFKGIFKDGYLYSGFQYLSENVDYAGEINNGVKEGKGKKYINNKLRFEGLFKNDKFVEGVVYNINNKKFFDGKINDDNKKEGKFFTDDNIFEGKFEDFCNIAEYVIDFTNKCKIIYEGEYKNGMKCGKGKDYLTGYEGEFLYGMYHGKGKNINNNIEGEYKNGKKTGYWKEPNFEGEYKDGLKNGEGKEDSWIGYYVNNCLHGKRMKDYQIKEYYFGEETNILNLRIEKNCIYFKNIKEYEGDIVNGIKEGKGTEFYKNTNKRYEGSFKNGNHHGNGKEYYDNGKIKYDGEFNNNMYDKKGIEYDENGQIIYDGEFKNGKYHGKGKLYRNGKIIYEGDFVEGKLQGKGKEFDKEGKVFYSGEFKNNAFNGLGARYFIKPYEGYWTNNHPDKLKQGFLYIGKYLKLA